MPDYTTLEVSREGDVLTIALNRPDVHNAFDDVLIGEMIALLEKLERDPEGARVIILRGNGPSFCAGADLKWMSRMVSYTRDENVRDSAQLAKMYELLDRLPLAVIGRIHGAAIGGGVGLVAACDIAIAESRTRFGLSEVKLGILPAVISPYVIAKIGASHARALFLTGERFTADRALQIGLIHWVAPGEEDLDRLVGETVEQLLGSGPEAVRECKRLIAHVSTHHRVDAIPYTIDAIAERRVSEEGQAGMQAFLRKEKAPWVKE
ncbi:MAG: enoyl-CoA hydratase-related protein [Thermoanaerobaculia bacterium]